MKEKIRDIIDMHFLMLEDPKESNEMKKKMLKEVPEHLSHDLNLLFQENLFTEEELRLIYGRLPINTFPHDPDRVPLMELFLKIHKMLQKD